MFSKATVQNKNNIDKYRRAQKTHFTPGVSALALEPGTAPPRVQLKGSGIPCGSLRVVQSKPPITVGKGVTTVGYPQSYDPMVFQGLSNPNNLPDIDNPESYLPSNVVSSEGVQ